MQLHTKAALGGTIFADIGPPTARYWNAKRSLLLVVSAPGSYRLSLYDAATLQLVSRFDRYHYPVNDVAFHPSTPLIAVATGRYDGGYWNAGNLLLWDSARQQVAPVFDRGAPSSREVSRCSFNNDGRALALVLRPSTDDEEAATGIHFLTTRLAPRSWHQLLRDGRRRWPPLTAQPDWPHADGYDPRQSMLDVLDELNALARAAGQPGSTR